MHPTADALPLIYINRLGRRVMPGVRLRFSRRGHGSAERGWRMTYDASCGFQRELDAA